MKYCKYIALVLVGVSACILSGCRPAGYGGYNAGYPGYHNGYAHGYYNYPRVRYGTTAVITEKEYEDPAVLYGYQYEREYPYETAVPAEGIYYYQSGGRTSAYGPVTRPGRRVIR